MRTRMLSSLALCAVVAGCTAASGAEIQPQASVTRFRVTLADQSASVMPPDQLLSADEILFRRSSSSAALRAAADADALQNAPGFVPSAGASASSAGERGLVHTYADARDCNASLLNIFGARLSCGDAGFTVPVLLNGDCPISACIIATDQVGPFGKWLDF
jgi:hypothetical protein